MTKTVAETFLFAGSKSPDRPQKSFLIAQTTRTAEIGLRLKYGFP